MPITLSSYRWQFFADIGELAGLPLSGACRYSVAARAAGLYVGASMPTEEDRGDGWGKGRHAEPASTSPPRGYAGQGARRTMFQSSLEQCEQFLAAAGGTGYATRPVQLFYALSQAGRAIVAASPRVGNQAWRVSGHGLTAGTSAAANTMPGRNTDSNFLVVM